MPEPRRLVGEQPERRGVRLGEPELRERDHLGEDAFGDRLGDAARRRPLTELVPESRHQLAATPAAHGASQRLRLPRREPRERLAHLEHLVLIEDHPQGLRERVFQERVVHRWLVAAAAGPGAALVLAPPHVGIHRAAHDGAGPHDRHFDREILEIARPGAAQHLDLRPALDLEQPHGVAAADAVVHRLVGEVDARQIGRRPLARRDQLDALLDQRQHAERQEVDLHEARVVAGVLVPLAHDAVFHRRPLERHDLDERPARDDHPTDVLRHVARQPGDLLGQLAQLLPQGGVLPTLEAGEPLQFVRQSDRPTVRQFGHLLDLSQRQIERLADLAHRGAEPVGGEGADQPHVLVAVALVDPPDQLLADLAREVEVDVGYRCEALVQEPAQEQAVGDRVDVRQAEQVADDGRHRRAAPTAGEQVSLGAPAAPSHVRRYLAGQVEQVVVDQEESTESMVFD